jgi:cardiolipin synthase (CMP-forming)
MRHVPNLLTGLRLVLVPFILIALLSGRYFPALALFAVAAVTDVLDGAAARRFGSTSAMGAYFDPIADKCLLTGIFLALAATSFVPWWLVVLIFGRDVLILGGALFVMRLTTERRFPPSVWGKLSTFVQICTVAFALGHAVFPASSAIAMLSSALVWPCAFFTSLSGIHYAFQASRILARPVSSRPVL